MSDRRAILHVDMDAFFASVEQHDDPALRGKPVLVGGGVVTSPSYEARAFGCRSAQPVAAALRLCPEAIVVRGRHDRYRDVSRQVFAVFHDFTPVVQGLSIDEAFLDVTGSRRLLGDSISIARHIKQRIRDEVGITASIGIAHNKFLAKLASDLEKPDGLTVVPHDDVAAYLAPLAISRMWGVGPKTEMRLQRLGVRTFGEMARLPEDILHAQFGDFGDHLRSLAVGFDDRPVRPGRGARSISKESTFFDNLNTRAKVRRCLLEQVERVAERLRAKSRVARTVTIKLRYGDFRTITRSSTLSEPTDRTDLFWTEARTLFERWAERDFAPVRLVGFGVSHIEESLGGRTSLFIDEDEERKRQLDRATDRIRQRFGRGAIHRGE